MHMKLNRLSLLWLCLAGLALLLAVPFITSAATVDITDGPALVDDAPQSNRLIVELDGAPAILWAQQNRSALTESGKLNMQSAALAQYIDSVRAEQAAFAGRLSSALPGASMATFLNENMESELSATQIALNSVTVDVGTASLEEAYRTLSRMEGVKAVYYDRQYYPDMYASNEYIDTEALWEQVGGQVDAGRGIKVASIDGGVHHEAPMFDGTGFSYPTGYPEGGYGDSENNNGKIIVSRAYFRPYDPPAAGDENVWPGENGTSHGVHTAGTAAGRIIEDGEYIGVELPTFSGVAPAAWLMSYRVFYASVNNDASFHTAEGLQAIEDMVADGADVVNNSWGGGPFSEGGQFDAIDNALINAWEAGIFVSMSAGNAGPNAGTGDHPSAEYINVAAIHDPGAYGAGFVQATAPDTLPEMPYAAASFGALIETGQTVEGDYLPAATVGDGSNFEGCSPFPEGAFDGKIALISRGSCEFGVKGLNAENAGATAFIIHNHATGGEALVSMGGGAVGDQVTITGVFIGNTNGLTLVDAYNDAGGATTSLKIASLAFYIGDTEDVIAGFSSRGPAVGGNLKPDIAAPGVSIMSQGYTPGATGEARHLGFGQVNGTSMASPHVAGAAAILRQIHPTWSNDDIKSALMTTAVYTDIFKVVDGQVVPAQPLDMGAGRINLTNASDPGVIASPPSLSFQQLVSGTEKTMQVSLTSIADTTETYEITTLYTGNSYTETQTAPGISLSATSITLAPGETQQLNVTFDGVGHGIGDDNQGYIVMSSENHDAHMPFAARVTPELKESTVLLIDTDFSDLLGYADYTQYYVDALEEIGYDYEYYNADINFNNPATLPESAVLAQYGAIIIFTGDHYRPDGTFTVATPLTARDMNRLTEYATQGGKIIVMGQDALGVTNDSFFQGAILGIADDEEYVLDAYDRPDDVIALQSAPAAFEGIGVDLSGDRFTVVNLSGANEVPPITTTTQGNARLRYVSNNSTLFYDVAIDAGDPVTITAAHIHSGAVGENGPVLQGIFPFSEPVFVTDTLSWSGSVELTAEEATVIEAGNTYINIHSTQNPSGELRGQVGVVGSGDGAGNQFFVDELLTSLFDIDPSGLGEDLHQGSPLLNVVRGTNVEDGVISFSHRDQPTLEYPETNYKGSSILAAFGLEGVNNPESRAHGVSRAELLDLMLNLLFDKPTIDTFTHSQDGAESSFTVNLASNIEGAVGIEYRFDWGDGTPYTDYFSTNIADGGVIAGHRYIVCGSYTVRVEGVDSYANHAIGTLDINVTENCEVPTDVSLSGAAGQITANPVVLVVLSLATIVIAGLIAARRRQQL